MSICSIQCVTRRRRILSFGPYTHVHHTDACTWTKRRSTNNRRKNGVGHCIVVVHAEPPFFPGIVICENIYIYINFLCWCRCVALSVHCPTFSRLLFGNGVFCGWFFFSARFVIYRVSVLDSLCVGLGNLWAIFSRIGSVCMFFFPTSLLFWDINCKCHVTGKMIEWWLRLNSILLYVIFWIARCVSAVSLYSNIH